MSSDRLVHENNFAMLQLLDAVQTDWSKVDTPEKEDVCHVVAYLAFQLGFESEEVHRCVNMLGSHITVEDINNYRHFNRPVG